MVDQECWEEGHWVVGHEANFLLIPQLMLAPGPWITINYRRERESEKISLLKTVCSICSGAVLVLLLTNAALSASSVSGGNGELGGGLGGCISCVLPSNGAIRTLLLYLQW